MPMVFSKNNSLLIVPFFTVKLPRPEYFMTVKSFSQIKCLKGVKFWVEEFYFKIYRNQKTLFKISFPPPPPPPRVPAKAFVCICVTIFYTLYGSGLLAQGGKGVQQPKNPEPKPIICLFHRIRNE